MSAIKEQLHNKIEAGQKGLHKIGWLNMPGYKPETWNPIIGCSKVSPGCDNCYAERMAIRIAGMERKAGTADYRYTLMPNADNKQSGWNGHTVFRSDVLQKPLEWKTPRMVFVCSMSDLFHEETSFEKIAAVFSVMSDLDQHIFIVLTKRPERMQAFYDWKREQMIGIEWTPSSNVWMGVTAENQEQADKRITILLKLPVAKRLVSIEPMLGPVDLTFIHRLEGEGEMENMSITNSLKKIDHFLEKRDPLDWVICGGESGPNARPMHPDWVRSVRDQCKAAEVPFFFKGWGAWRPDGTKENYSFLIHSKERLMGNDVMSKKPHLVFNTDHLDGIQYKEWPELENKEVKEDKVIKDSK